MVISKIKSWDNKMFSYGIGHSAYWKYAVLEENVSYKERRNHLRTIMDKFLNVAPISVIADFAGIVVHKPVEKRILQHSRANSTKVVFLITDGYSNGGDPRPIAASLRNLGVEIFTLGIWQGNIRELQDMASHPKEEHCYILHSFAEFEALARRALHE
eukprot:g32013.t1